MAERKFTGASAAEAGEDLNRDYENAKCYDKLRVGELGVYFRDGLKTRHIPYTDMDRVFIRVQETRSRMCCGQANFNYYRIVFVRDGKEFADYLSEKEAMMDEALAVIAAHGVATGFVRKDSV